MPRLKANILRPVIATTVVFLFCGLIVLAVNQYQEMGRPARDPFLLLLIIAVLAPIYYSAGGAVLEAVWPRPKGKCDHCAHTKCQTGDEGPEHRQKKVT